jgi:hypothetical protein
VNVSSPLLLARARSTGTFVVELCTVIIQPDSGWSLAHLSLTARATGAAALKGGRADIQGDQGE